MTREEEIRQYLKERNIPITSLEANSIIEGIEWADKHPNLSEEEQVGMGELGMYWQKKSLIAKACEWLDKVNTDNYMDSGIFQMSELISDFRKAMEE